jgi:hypothetical protein
MDLLRGLYKRTPEVMSCCPSQRGPTTVMPSTQEDSASRRRTRSVLGNVAQATGEDSPLAEGTPARFESACEPVRLRLRFCGVSPDGTSVRDEPSQ